MHVLVVGGGIIGVTTAWELQQRGHTVEVLEASDGLASQTSYANGGMLTAGMCEPWNAPGVWKDLISSFFDQKSPMKLHLAAIPAFTLWGLRFLYNSNSSRFNRNMRASYELSAYSVEITDKWVKDLSIDCDYRPSRRGSSVGVCGDLKIFKNQDAALFSIDLADQLKAQGLESKLLDTDEVLALEPALFSIRDEISCGIHYPNDAAGDACAYTRDLAAKATEIGTHIHLNTKVNKITKSLNGGCLLSTDSGDFYGDAVVVSAATQAAALLSPLGIRLPIKPVKGYSLTLNGSNIPQEILPRMAVINQAMHAAVNPLGDRIRVAGTAEFVHNSKPTLSQSRVENLIELLRATYPRVAEAVATDDSSPWCGFRPMSVDGKPFIGKSHIEGIYVNSGHGYLGWTQAAGSASLLADIIENKKAAIDANSFSVSR